MANFSRYTLTRLIVKVHSSHILPICLTTEKSKTCYVTTCKIVFKPGMWKRLFFKRFRFRFHTYRFRFRFHQQKMKKRPLTISFNFCGSVACLLLHFIILRKQKPSFIAITLPTSLKLIVSNYSVFLFLRYQNSR